MMVWHIWIVNWYTVVFNCTNCTQHIRRGCNVGSSTVHNEKRVVRYGYTSYCCTSSIYYVLYQV